MDNGLLNLAPVCNSDVEEVKDIAAKLCEHPNVEKLPIDTALTILLGCGRGSQWLYKQLLFTTALYIDGKITEDFDAPDGPVPGATSVNVGGDVNLLESEKSQQRNTRTRRWRSRMRVVRRVPTEAKMQVFQAYFAIRAVFDGCRCVGFAFDASRIGGRSRLLGFATEPGGQGIWLPPMATGGT